MILFNNGPWGSKDKGNGGSPWGGGKKQGPQGNGGDRGRPPRGSSGDVPPEVEAFLREAQNRFKGFSNRHGRGGGKGPPAPSIGAVFFLAVLVWLATGVYRVQPAEHAVVRTFGKWTTTKTNPGLGYHVPWPVQTVDKVDVTQDRRVTIGFNDLIDRKNASTSTDVPFESLMVTGDENIIKIHFVVLWRINDAGKYLFQIRDPETTIKKVSESAMREIIGRTKIQQALTEGRASIESETRELMQNILDEYQSGIAVNNVQLLSVDPPAPVLDAFDDVQRARADKESLRNEAQKYKNDIVPKARGEVRKIIQDAEAYQAAVINKAEGDAQRFLSVYTAYKMAKDVTEKRIYIETMQEILRNSKKVIVGDSGGGPVLPYLSLDKLQKGTQ